MFDDERGGGPALYVGGRFTNAGGKPANYVARWGFPHTCSGDIDGDGEVGQPDLGILLADYLCGV